MSRPHVKFRPPGRRRRCAGPVALLPIPERLPHGRARSPHPRRFGRLWCQHRGVRGHQWATHHGSLPRTTGRDARKILRHRWTRTSPRSRGQSGTRESRDHRSRRGCPPSYPPGNGAPGTPQNSPMRPTLWDERARVRRGAVRSSYREHPGRQKSSGSRRYPCLSTVVRIFRRGQPGPSTRSWLRLTFSCSDVATVTLPRMCGRRRR